jgi:hypothetical protein
MQGCCSGLNAEPRDKLEILSPEDAAMLKAAILTAIQLYHASLKETKPERPIVQILKVTDTISNRKTWMRYMRSPEHAETVRLEYKLNGILKQLTSRFNSKPTVESSLFQTRLPLHVTHYSNVSALNALLEAIKDGTIAKVKECACG